VVLFDVVSDIGTIAEGDSERYFNLTAEIRADSKQLGIDVVAGITILLGSTAKSNLLQ
jgi:hydrogenase maturation factor HypE